MTFDPTTATPEGGFDPATASPESPPVPPSSVGEIAVKAPLRGLRNTVGMVADTPEAMWNLGKATLGTGMEIARNAPEGTVPRFLGDLTRGFDLPSVSKPDTISSYVNGLISRVADLRTNPQGGWLKALDTGLETAGGSVGPGAGGSFRNAAVNVLAPAVGAATGEAVGGDVGKFVGTLAAPAAAQASAAVIGQKGAQAAKQFADAGVNPTLVDVNPATASVQKGAETLPIAREIGAKARATQVSQGAKKLTQLVDEVGGDVPAAAAGSVVKDGIQKWWGTVSNEFKLAQDEVFKAVPADTIIQPNKVLNELITATSPGKLNEASRKIDPDLVKRLEDMKADYAKNGGISLETLKQIKTEIGAIAYPTGMTLATNQNQGQYRALYKALGDDIADGVKKVDPVAGQTLAEANAAYSAGRAKYENYLEGLFKKLDLDPQKAFNSLVAGGKSGSQEIRAAMSTLEPKDRNAVASAVLSQMGKNGDQFSFAKYVSDWGNLTDDAKIALLGGTTNKSMLKDLDNLAEVAKSVKAGTAAAGNPSGTASSASAAGVIFGIFNPKVWAGLAGGAGIESLATSPTFIKWAASAANNRAGDTASTLQKLANMMKAREPELLPQAEAFISSQTGRN